MLAYVLRPRSDLAAEVAAMANPNPSPSPSPSPSPNPNPNPDPNPSPGPNPDLDPNPDPNQVTPLGKLITIVVMISGIITIALPITVIGSNFAKMVEAARSPSPSPPPKPEPKPEP